MLFSLFPVIVTPYFHFRKSLGTVTSCNNTLNKFEI
nr:MAG TPA: hypothetical protein [Caudoviricetes sp.]